MYMIAQVLILCIVLVVVSTVKSTSSQSIVSERLPTLEPYHVPQGTPSDKIQNIIYINLAESVDRRKQIEGELNRMKLGSPAYRFPAIRKSPGAIGCFLSHLGGLKYSLDMPGHVLMLEDDFEFLVDRTMLEGRIAKADRLTKGRWDVIVLGQFASHMAPVHNLASGVFRLLKATTTSGYLVNDKYKRKLYAKWLAAFEPIANKGSNFGHDDNLDQIQIAFQKEDLWIGFRSPLGGQRIGHSFIGNGMADNRWKLSKDGKTFYHGSTAYEMKMDDPVDF